MDPIHIWYVYLHLSHMYLIFMVNVGRYTIHGSYGIMMLSPTATGMDLCVCVCVESMSPKKDLLAKMS